MSRGKYLVLRMKCVLSIPGNLVWSSRFTSLPRREQMAKDFCWASQSRNWEVSGAIPSAAGVVGHLGKGTYACACLVVDARLNEEAMFHVLLKEKGRFALCQGVG